MEMKKGAIISKCGKYRFQLWRIWDETKPLVMWVMHNPSTADADSDDPTIRRIIQFSKDFGCGGLYVGNLSPYRATDPKELNYLTPDELLPVEVFDHTRQMISKCDLHMIACGIPARNVSDKVITSFPFIVWNHLGLTKHGAPKHPLYLPKHLRPIKL